MSQCPGSYGYVIGKWHWNRCPYCGKDVRVTKKGVMFKHREGAKEGGE